MLYTMLLPTLSVGLTLLVDLTLSAGSTLRSSLDVSTNPVFDHKGLAGFPSVATFVDDFDDILAFHLVLFRHKQLDSTRADHFVAQVSPDRVSRPLSSSHLRRRSERSLSPG